MSGRTHTVSAKTDWITIDLSQPLPWWLRPQPLSARVMVHDEGRKARRKAEKVARKRRRRAG